jgi:Ca2+-binding EF-hand superfamily protein
LAEFDKAMLDVI